MYKFGNGNSQSTKLHMLSARAVRQELCSALTPKPYFLPLGKTVLTGGAAEDMEGDGESHQRGLPNFQGTVLQLQEKEPLKRSRRHILA